jgi:hypothetical protein
MLPTVSEKWRAPAAPSKSENTNFPTEGRKAVTCYFVDSSRKLASPKCTEAQHFTSPTGESILP